MLQLESAIVRKNFVTCDQTENLQIIIFPYKLVLGHLTYSPNGLTINHLTSVLIEYNTSLNKLITFLLQTFELLRDKRQCESEVLILRKNSIQLRRNIQAKTFITIEGGCGEKVFSFRKSRDLARFLQNLNGILFFGIWPKYENHLVFKTFLDGFEKKFGKKSLLKNCLNFDEIVRDSLLSKALEDSGTPISQINHVANEIRFNLSDLETFFLLNDFKEDKDFEAKRPLLNVVTSTPNAKKTAEEAPNFPNLTLIKEANNSINDHDYGYVTVEVNDPQQISYGGNILHFVRK